MKAKHIWQAIAICTILLFGAACANNEDNPPKTSTSNRVLSDFDFLEYGMSYAEIVAHVGEAERDVGSGVYVMVYELSDGTMVMLSFFSLDALRTAVTYDPETEIRRVIIASPDGA